MLHATEVVEYRERNERLEEQETENDRTKDRPENLPDDLPSKAAITIKKINDNRYYYWQWRDGNKIKSKYKGPLVQASDKGSVPPIDAERDE